MLSAAYETPATYADCKRTEPRTNMFVMAKLVFAGTVNPVKVRNMSALGALVEGAALPQPGMACRLTREGIAIEAEVVWGQPGKIGLRFRNRAQIDQWYPAGRRTQSEVDRAVAQARVELTAGAQFIPAASPQRAPIMCTALSAAEVHATADAMEALSDDLAGDPAVIARFMTKLQTLDIAVQTLRKLADGMQ